MPDLRVGARSGDDHHAAAVRDRRVHERHVRLVADARLVAGDHTGVLRRGDTLAGQSRLVDLQRRCLDDPAVRAHVVARGEQDDIAHDDLVAVDLHLRAIASNPCGCLEHRLQRVHGALRLALLAHPTECVQRRDQEDGDARCDLADQHRGDRRRDEDDLHVAGVLRQELPPAGHRRLGRQRIRSSSGEGFGCLRRREALGGIDVELRCHFLRRQGIPARRPRSGRGRGYGTLGHRHVLPRTASGCWSSTNPARRTRRGPEASASWCRAPRAACRGSG